MRSLATFLFSLVLVSGWVLSVQAEVPKVLHYQGYLTDDAGSPVHCPTLDDCSVVDGVELTFRLYDSEEGELSFWFVTHEAVPVHQGVFNISLGSKNAIDATDFEKENVYLGVSINGGDELMPRQRLVSSAFAIRADTAALAQDANTLGGVDAADYVTSDAVGGLCVTDEDLALVLDEKAYCTECYSDEKVGLYLTENGYTPGPGFSGSFEDLQDVPAALADLTSDADKTLSYNGKPVINAAGEWIGPATGLQGPPGTAGKDGADGAPGKDGAEGKPGNDGTPGKDGAEGKPGEDGAQGLKGDPGAKGEEGPQGLEGPQGSPGDNAPFADIECPANTILKFDGTKWLCAPETMGIEVVQELGACDANTLGKLVYDLGEGLLRVCNKSGWSYLTTCNGVCPELADVACGVPSQNDCGKPCEGTGTGLNTNQCNASVVACGSDVKDACGNLCVGKGDGLDVTQCDAQATACGVPVVDSCGNSCGETGIQCAAEGATCVQGQCLFPLSCKTILDDGLSTGSGAYTIDPDGAGPADPTQVYCDMETDGGGWTRIVTALPTPLDEIGVDTDVVLKGQGDTSTGAENGWVGLSHWNQLAPEKSMRMKCTGGAVGSLDVTTDFTLSEQSPYNLSWNAGCFGQNNTGQPLTTADMDNDSFGGGAGSGTGNCATYNGDFWPGEGHGWGWHKSCHCGSFWNGGGAKNGPGKPVCWAVGGECWVTGSCVSDKVEVYVR